MPRPGACLLQLAALLSCLLGCALVSPSGCGKKGSSEPGAAGEPIKGPATVEQGARLLYVDTGVMPAEITISAMGAELGNAAGGNP